jgi:UDP-glucose 4-epimerase
MARRAQKKVILVTGVGSYWGFQVAHRLLQNRDHSNSPEIQVIGVDAQPPEKGIQGLDFIQADIRNPLFVEILKLEMVDTVCHLIFAGSRRPSEANFDLNVMGTMKVLGACAEAGVKKVILKSSTSVYGALPTNPGYLTEKHPLQGSQVYGNNRNLLEIEAFCNGFSRQVPNLMLTILRFASIVGTEADTPMTRFLKAPLAPTLLGFDPLMQVIHEKDVVNALIHVIENDHPGVFNVAAEGILPLSRLTALAAKVPIPVIHLVAYWGLGLVNAVGLPGARYWPMEPDYLRYGWVADLEKMREELKFYPAYTAEEALREFAGKQRLRHYVPESVALAYDEERLRDTLERRKRARE